MNFIRPTILVTSVGVLAGAIGLQSGNEWFYSRYVMPSVQLFDAETAHTMAVRFAKFGLAPKFPTKSEDKELLKTTLWNLNFDSPLGLAAGFDKHAQCMHGMLQMGFAFVEVGSVTPQPQEGNAKPRLFRLSEDSAVINRYGFNSVGADEARQNLMEYRANKTGGDGLVAVNVGKNKTTVHAADDYVVGVEKLGEFADYLVVNVSSPNTPGLRKMQGRHQLQDLIKKVLLARDRLPNNKRPPIVVKIAPDVTTADMDDIADVVTSPESRIDGLIISNTTVSRPDSLTSVNRAETGGLSGQPLRDLSTSVIREMYKRTRGEVAIIGVGGVRSGKDVYEKIRAGASLVQLYSSLALEGPPVVKRVKSELADLLRRDGVTSVADVVGADVQLDDLESKREELIT